MKYNQEDEVGLRLEVEHVLNDKDEIVEGHEADNSDKMGINQLATTYLSV